MSEEKPQYVTDAEEMLGAGYDQPTVVLEAARTYTARKNGRMVEIDEPAWVKFSTGFKSELAKIDEFSLKVFLYIGLSINWQTGEAYPGVRLIAEDTGMDKGTVVNAVKKLEELGFLTIQRKDGAKNTYKPVRYISIGTVRGERTLPSGEDAELSGQNGELSGGGRVDLHNKKNKKEQDTAEVPHHLSRQLNSYTCFCGFIVAANETECMNCHRSREKHDKDLADANRKVDYIIAADRKVSTVRQAVQEYFRINVNWSTKQARQFMEFVEKEQITPEQVKVAGEKWTSDSRFNWQIPNLKLIFEKWPQLFPKVTKEPVLKQKTGLEMFLEDKS